MTFTPLQCRAIYKAIMVAKFPSRDDQQLEIMGSPIVNEVLSLIGNSWSEGPIRNPISKSQEDVKHILELIADMRVSTWSTWGKDERISFLKILAYPFTIDESDLSEGGCFAAVLAISD